MKKNFFKKLSFVLALAMIISSIAPASGAFAATKAPTLSSSKEYLFLGTDDDSSFDFNVNNKLTGWTYAWASSNKAVATVSKSGLVKGLKIGTAKVSVTIKNKAGELVDKLTATVIVKDNIADVKIKNAPEGDKLAIGKEFDFNRSFTTVGGSTTKTTSIVRWTVDNDGDINDAGLFSADKAGKYTITARAFQSVAKYELWAGNKEKYADYVLDFDTKTVNVIPSLTDINQLTSTKFEVVFDSKVDDVLKTFAVKNDAGVSQVVKEVKWNEAGTTATVELYLALTDAKEYTVSVGDYEEKFVASVGDAAKIVVTAPALVEYGVSKSLASKVYDKNDVEVAVGANASVSYKITNNVGWIDGTTITLFNIDDVATVVATYHTGKYNEAGDEITFDSEAFSVKAVKSLAATTKSLTAWTISTAADKEHADYTTVSHSITLSDTTGYSVFAKGKDSADADMYFTKFSSTNPAVLIVNEDGSLYPVAVGQVNVIAEAADGNKQVLLVDVKAAKAASALSLKGANLATLSNALAVGDQAKFELVVKDQYQNEMADAAVTVDQYEQPTGGLDLQYDASVAGEVVIYPYTDASGLVKAIAGTYRFKLTTQGKTAIVTVVVKEPAAAVAYSKLTVDTTSLDMAISDNTAAGSLPTVTIYSRTYDNTGIANGVTTSTIKITGPDNYSVTTTAVGTYVFTPVTGSVGSVATAIKTGTYKVEGTSDSDGKALVPVYFALTNTQKAPTVKVASITLDTTTGTDIAALLLGDDLFSVTSNADATSIAITGYTVKNSLMTANAFAAAGTYSVLVDEITVVETFDHYQVQHTVDQNTIITVKVQ